MAGAVASLLSEPAVVGGPMNYLRTFGPRADPATALTWGLIVLSMAVIVIVTALVLAGVLARRTRGRAATADVPVQRGASGLMWIYVGLALTVVALGVALIWTMQVLAAIDSPASRPHVTIEVTGHQWWWEARYVGDSPADSFHTANEIHIPTGQPVLLRLYGADVIHSFWIPALTGKTDTIPGRTNLSWMQTDRPGIYRGQCTEYCGVQHAHMAAYVVAEPPAAFEAWRQAQLAPAAATAGAGQGVFVARCHSCHTVRGTGAAGTAGPDLTHLMSRQTLAAGVLPNTPGALSGWIADPQSAKPGAAMPATFLSGPQLTAVVAYLETLK
jgi:cytochrome c oxidase subunit 2